MRMNTEYTRLNSVMAERPHSRTSDRYSFVPTYKVINLLEDNGWQVSDSRETNARGIETGFQKHMIRLRRQGDIGRLLEVDELIPEIALTNSHDAGSSFQLLAALFRCFCSNQCVVGDSTIASHRVTHKGYTNEKILDAVYRIVEDTPKIIDNVQGFKNIPLSIDEQQIFASAALDVLYPEEEKWEGFNKELSAKKLIQPKRQVDKENNLWTTYNVVQEKFLKGDKFMIPKIDKYGRDTSQMYYPTAKKTKEIKSIDKDIKLNKALWTLTEKMAELKQS